MKRPDDSSNGSMICSLCQREVPKRLITLHHLKPKQKGGVAADRTPTCKPCHKQVHAVFSNSELAREYASIEALRSDPRLAGFLKWIARQKGDRDFRTVQSADHPGRKRRRR